MSLINFSIKIILPFISFDLQKSRRSFPVINVQMTLNLLAQKTNDFAKHNNMSYVKLYTYKYVARKSLHKSAGAGCDNQHCSNSHDYVMLDM
ncbi:MAG: hypothetical protein AMJ61_05785 [Desulfobacterales bacterium SG8_35_2]|nr:MAG: hypothetical protein AMJ61_05785 [Desulfobacterales bacterium SG8_35_2]